MLACPGTARQAGGHGHRQELQAQLLARVVRDQLARRGVQVIDRTYPLEEVPEAIRYLEHGHARGKVVITV